MNHGRLPVAPNYLRNMARALSLLVLFTVTVASMAQDASLDRAVLPMGSRTIQARMLKEKVPMEAAWADTLLSRAEGARPMDAVRMLEHAVVILDSLQERALERDALFALSKAQERVGRSKDALISLHAAHFLKDSLAAMDRADSAATVEKRIAAMQATWERTLAQQAENLRSEQEQHQANLRRSERWLIAAVILIAVLVVVLIGSWLRSAAHRRARGHAVSQHKATIAPELPKPNVLRPAPVVKDEVLAPPVLAAELDPEAAMLLALFHKHMPERFRTLQEARSRGDHEKVVRVLASMRPQLASHDAPRFAARCAGLIAARETVLEAVHAPDLDRLIADVELALRAGDQAG